MTKPADLMPTWHLWKSHSQKQRVDMVAWGQRERVERTVEKVHERACKLNSVWWMRCTEPVGSTATARSCCVALRTCQVCEVWRGLSATEGKEKICGTPSAQVPFSITSQKKPDKKVFVFFFFPCMQAKAKEIFSCWLLFIGVGFQWSVFIPGWEIQHQTLMLSSQSLPESMTVAKTLGFLLLFWVKSCS